MSNSNKGKVHLLECEGAISQEQYDRLKMMCDEHFGRGHFILLEGGVKYAGVTDIPLPIKEKADES